MVVPTAPGTRKSIIPMCLVCVNKCMGISRSMTAAGQMLGLMPMFHQRLSEVH